MREFEDELGGCHLASSEIHFEAETLWCWKCSWRPLSFWLQDTLQGCNWVSVESNFKAKFWWIGRYIWRLWLCEVEDALGGHYPVHLKTAPQLYCRYAWRLWTSEFRNTLGGCNILNVQMKCEVVIRSMWWCTVANERSTLAMHLWGSDRAKLDANFEVVNLKVVSIFFPISLFVIHNSVITHKTEVQSSHIFLAMSWLSVITEKHYPPKTNSLLLAFSLPSSSPPWVN